MLLVDTLLYLCTKDENETSIYKEDIHTTQHKATFSQTFNPFSYNPIPRQFPPPFLSILPFHKGKLFLCFLSPFLVSLLHLDSFHGVYNWPHPTCVFGWHPFEPLHMGFHALNLIGVVLDFDPFFVLSKGLLF